MKSNLTWKEMMETHTEKRNRMKAPALVAIVVMLHVSAVGAFIFIQGCGTANPGGTPAVEPPSPPVMPTRDPGSTVRPRPVFQPPVEVPEAPSMFDRANAKTYTVQKGDSLSKIASRCGVNTRELQELNNITNPNQIRIGQKLVLPPYAKVPTGLGAPTGSGSPPAAATTPSGPITASGDSYVIQSGDSLSKIASRHGVTTAALQKLNGIDNPNRIRVGQKLKIPTGDGTTEPPATPPVPGPSDPLLDLPGLTTPPDVDPDVPPQDVVFTYTIMEGETLEDVAKNFAVFKEDILKFNNIDDPASVKPGMKIKIPPMAY